MSTPPLEAAPDADGLRQRKRALREEARRQRRATSEEEHRRASAALAAQLAALPEVRGARTVAFFAPFDGEVDPTGLLELEEARGMCAVWPHISPEDDTLSFYHHPAPVPLGRPGAAAALLASMPVGRWGLRVPQGPLVAPEALDLVLTPGILFSPSGARLGLGKGHYDRFLAMHPDTFTLGVGYSWQLVDALPLEAHDQPLRLIVTPDRVARPCAATGSL